MTIGAWFIFGVVAMIVATTAFYIIKGYCESNTIKVITILAAVAIIAGALWCCRWWCTSTASGIRAMTDQKAELNNGLERTINIYTADGELLAKYEGKIDIEDNAGGYVIFDYEGNRYTYYNCFVESIAKIDQ